MKRNGRLTTISRDAGTTVMEFLVSAVIGSLMLGGLVSQYSNGVKVSIDHRIRIATNLQAQAVVQAIGSELRVLGNGVPFDQPNFEIGESTLSDPTVTEPILVASSTATSISFRVNETGEVSLLTQDFDPGLSTTIFLTDVSSLAPGDPIFLSNSMMAGDEGLYGVIASVDNVAGSVTIDAGFVTSAGAVFVMGSVLEEVPIVTYNSPGDGSGVTRDSGFGTTRMSDRSTMVLEYLDQNQAPVALPLTTADLVNSVRSIRVTINQTSRERLSDGAFYTTSFSQIFGLRNLNYVY